MADLLRAWCSDIAFSLVVLEACLFKRQIKKIQHPPDLTFKVLDDIFVLDAQDKSRQYLLPVIHKIEIGSIVIS